MMMHWDNLKILPLIHAVITLAHRYCYKLINDLLLKLEPISSERPMNSSLIKVLY